MKIKIDENLPASLAEDLGGEGHDVDTAMDEGLGGRPDADVWAGAQSEGRFLVTQDLEFSDIRRFRPGTHAGILLVRLRQPGRRALRTRVAQLFRDEDVECWARAFIVATDSKVRVRRPTGIE